MPDILKGRVVLLGQVEAYVIENPDGSVPFDIAQLAGATLWIRGYQVRLQAPGFDGKLIPTNLGDIIDA